MAASSDSSVMARDAPLGVWIGGSPWAWWSFVPPDSPRAAEMAEATANNLVALLESGAAMLYEKR